MLQYQLEAELRVAGAVARDALAGLDKGVVRHQTPQNRRLLHNDGRAESPAELKNRCL